jgi:hypothetical protein
MLFAMKTLLIFSFFSLLSFATFAAEGDKGIGLILGNPTGLSGKYWLSESHAVDGGLAWSFGKHSNLSLHSDYLLHNQEAFFFNDTVPLDLFYGIGARMEFDDDIELGVRIPVGLVHNLKQDSADVFAEIAPILDFVSRTGLELHFAVGGRYYFR